MIFTLRMHYPGEVSYQGRNVLDCLLADVLRAYSYLIKIKYEDMGLSQVAVSTLGTNFILANSKDPAKVNRDEVYQAHNPFHYATIKQGRIDRARNVIPENEARRLTYLIEKGKVPNWAVAQIDYKTLTLATGN